MVSATRRASVPPKLHALAIGKEAFGSSEQEFVFWSAWRSELKANEVIKLDTFSNNSKEGW